MYATPFIIMFVHFIFNKCINLFDFLFLFNFNFENVKEWFCVSPFTTVNIISCFIGGENHQPELDSNSQL